MKERYCPEDTTWTIRQGSALDAEFIKGLGTFDVVYSWGVLHHTGAMWQALENAIVPVAVGGSLCIAIYNDQGLASRFWKVVKKTYVRSPKPIRFLLVSVFAAYFKTRSLVASWVKPKPPKPERARGMSAWYDLIDWVGGYPFEVAKPEEIVKFYRQRGFNVERMETCGTGLGCNEFVFRKDAVCS